MNIWDLIYSRDSWSGGSGPGSKRETTVEYRQLIEEFIRVNDIRYILDVGCGDGYLASLIDWGAAEYCGIDPSHVAIERATRTHPLAWPNKYIVGHIGRSITLLPCIHYAGKLQNKTLAIVKDVLQHVSITQSRAILEALKPFRFVIVTNDIPDADYSDIEEGGWRPVDIRQLGYAAVVLKEFDSVPFKKRTLLMERAADNSSVGTETERAADVLRRQQKADNIPQQEGAAGGRCGWERSDKDKTSSDNTERYMWSGPRSSCNIIIPKVFHQTWKTHDIPAPFKREWCSAWCELNPEWEYNLWTDEDLQRFVEREFPQFLATYNGYDSMIKRVDAARYLILQRLGGVFIDLDFTCLKPLAPLLSNASLVFGSQHPGDWVQSVDHVCNAWMASAPGHQFWDGIEFDLMTHADLGVLDATGPNFLTRRASNCHFFLPIGEYPKILPSAYLYPFAWNDARKELLREHERAALAELFPDAYAVTFWTGSWL